MEEDKIKIAEKRVKDLKGFYAHLIVYCVVIVILAIINLVTMRIGGYTFYWFLFPLGGWGFGLFWHAMGVFVFGSVKKGSWEKKKIEEVMKQMDED